MSLGAWEAGEGQIVSSVYSPTPGGEVHVVETRELLEGGMVHAQVGEGLEAVFGSCKVYYFYKYTFL